MRIRPSTPAGVLALAALSSIPALARAGGFELPDNGVRSIGRGGANAVGVEDLTAVHYNPALLARQHGKLSLMWDHNLVFHDESYRRAALGDGWGKDAGTSFDTVKDGETLFPLGAFVSVGSDFGLSDGHDDVMFAASVYGPSAYGKQSWPGYGPQSWMLTETNLILLYYSLSAAWQREGKYGIGATVQWVDMPTMQYELAIDSDPTTPDPSKVGSLQPIPEKATGTTAPTHLLAKLDLKDHTAFTAIVGGFWRFHPNLEIAVAGRILPIKLEGKGGVKLDHPELSPEGVKVSLPFTLPMMARGGIRYFTDVFDVELDAFWEGWSALERYDVAMKGQINGVDVKDLAIEKQWQDTVSLRLGGAYKVLPGVLDLRAGSFVENGAAPDAYSHIDFPSFDRLGVGGGLTWHVDGTALDLSLGYMHIFQEDRTVSELEGKQFQQRPLHPCPEECGGLSGVVANAGTFQTSFDILSLGIDYRL